MSNEAVKSKLSPTYHYKDLEKQAQKKLTHEVFTYIQSGSGNEETLRANEEAFKKYKLVPEFLHDVSKCDLSISVLGQTFQTPFLLAPVGHLGAAHPEGELAVARAAKGYQVPYVASTVSTYTLEEIADALGDTPRWFQLYWSKDSELTVSFVQRAEKAGYSAIVITIDTPALGFREANLTNQFFPVREGYGLANYFQDPIFRSRLNESPEENWDAAIDELVKITFHPKLTWNDLAFLRKHTNLPIILKGVLHPKDSIRAIEYMVDGVIVSNHGGRQLDGAVASLDALPKVVEAVNGKIPVLFDSGIRRGPDVVKVISLGADAVLIGRPYVYGLAHNGQDGVEELFNHLLTDIDTTLATAGKSSIRTCQLPGFVNIR
ncbi:FMN-dependent dehydrogenase, includes L-lactate dehydrogenase and type II isopentenyl diphosphate isomerase [Salinibacillus kushneri]|uniref:L-lactate oxidase n=1 Tax=Salinibacillus kushneri TaxID=237682 RepID=A0A1H9ZF41_9BACI|nr:alpha-hydroxy-acid oxidizing protein [Salinibacillus kushneri]SES80208.1 FMN-dependent dehydrogenase, includes L-lactate dehydrogenase and type II isopentenyl diphosphate isomerase [Salinibacillus kushneri]